MAQATRVRRMTQDPHEVFRRRVAMGLTQRQLGDRSGLSGAQVSRIEAGKSSASVESLHALAGGLDCEVTALMPTENSGEESA